MSYDYHKMSKDAQWIVCKLLTFVPDTEIEKYPPDIRIIIDGYEIDNLNPLFEQWAEALDYCSNKMAAKKVLEHFHLQIGSVQEETETVERQLKAKLRELYGLSVEWEEW